MFKSVLQKCFRVCCKNVKECVAKMLQSVLQKCLRVCCKNVNECVAKMLQNEIKTYLQTYQQREGISAKWLKLKFKKTKKKLRI